MWLFWASSVASGNQKGKSSCGPTSTKTTDVSQLGEVKDRLKMDEDLSDQILEALTCIFGHDEFKSDVQRKATEAVAKSELRLDSSEASPRLQPGVGSAGLWLTYGCVYICL